MKKSEPPKVLKREDGVDFISNMPDAILVLILSRLPSTEEVSRTSILSRRWRYLWTSIPSLDICWFLHRGELKKNEFKKFVNWVLVNKSVNLDRFRLFCSNSYSMSTVGRWINAAVTRNVKQLDLRFGPKKESEDIEMPHCLVNCGSLEVLRLSLFSGRLKFPSFSGFSALRVLELEDVDLLDGDSVKCFLESCPLLEVLALVSCIKYKPDLLCISCPKLKKLKFHHNSNYGGLSGCLKISCPNLVFLELTGYITSEILIDRLDLLKEAVLGPFYIYNSFVLHGGISQVESLRIDLYLVYQRIDVAHDPALPNLKTLELTTTSATFNDHQFTRILNFFPKLESLSLIIENVFTYPEAFLGPGDVKSAEAEAEEVFIPDVKWVESFEYNVEKPKLYIESSGGAWMFIIAKWGKEARFSHWIG